MDPKALKYFDGECFKHFGADCNCKIVGWIKRGLPQLACSRILLHHSSNLTRICFKESVGILLDEGNLVFASCWDRESQRALERCAVGIVEAHPNENCLQVLNLWQHRVFGWLERELCHS